MRRDLLVLTAGMVLTAGVNATAWSGVNGGVNGADMLWVGWGAPSGWVATPALGLRAELLLSTAISPMVLSRLPLGPTFDEFERALWFLDRPVYDDPWLMLGMFPIVLDETVPPGRIRW